MKLELEKEYYCAWHNIGKTKIVELWEGKDCLVTDFSINAVVAVSKHSLFEKEDENFELEKLAFRLNRREATGYDLIALIAKTIKMMIR